MPLRLCSYEFLRDVLAKKKKLFHRVEIVIPKLPKHSSLSVKLMIEAAKKSKEVLEYLPD
jgi:hypothetical protein